MDCLFTLKRGGGKYMRSIFIIQKIFDYTIIIVCFAKKIYHIWHKWTMNKVRSMHHHCVSDMARFIQSPRTDYLFTRPRNAQQCMGDMFIV